MTFKIISFVFCLVAFSVMASADEISQPPNILFIMSDDHAERAISSYGSDLIDTPNIDRIAHEVFALLTASLRIQSVRRVELSCSRGSTVM